MNSEIFSALSCLTDPVSQSPLGLDNRIRRVELNNRHAVIFLIELNTQGKTNDLKEKIKSTLMNLEGIDKVTVNAETRYKTTLIKTKQQQSNKSDVSKPKPLTRPATIMIAVASGKGGVGKSTVAANLAASYSALGFKTGFLDADIYGPSAPRLFGLTSAPGLRKTGAGIEPQSVDGIKLVSMGFIVGERDPVIWRAPEVTSAINQFLKEE